MATLKSLKQCILTLPTIPIIWLVTYQIWVRCIQCAHILLLSLLIGMNNKTKKARKITGLNPGSSLLSTFLKNQSSWLMQKTGMTYHPVQASRQSGNRIFLFNCQREPFPAMYHWKNQMQQLFLLTCQPLTFNKPTPNDKYEIMNFIIVI